MPRNKRPTAGSKSLTAPERYLLEVVVMVVALAVLVNAFANPNCLSGCNADFWGVTIINGVLATTLLFALVVLLQTRRKRKL